MNIFEKVVIGYLSIWVGLFLEIIVFTLMGYLGLISLGWCSFFLLFMLLIGWVIGTYYIYRFTGAWYIRYKLRREKTSGET